MDHAVGGGRSGSRLRDRLARMFRPGTLLRSTCNTTASTWSSSSSTAIPGGAGSTSRALQGAVARDSRLEDSFLGSSSRRGYAVGHTESFSTAVDRLHRRAKAVVAPAPPSRFSVDAPAPPPPLMLERDKEDHKSPRDRLVRKDKQSSAKMKLLSNDPYGFSSSDDTDDDVVFSSDADEGLSGGRGGAHKKLAVDTFFSSSRSFSSDSSELFYTTTNKKKKMTKGSNKTIRSPAAAPRNKPPSRSAGKTKRRAASRCDTCGVRDGVAEDQPRPRRRSSRGFAVVKRSPDPYGDFRSSMVEMIVGRQLFGEAELERLLRWYLSLNAARHHPVILQAFSDIWVVLHGGG